MAKWIGKSILSLLFIAIGIVFWVTAPSSGGTSGDSAFGPGHFPKLLSAFLVLLSGFDFFREISKRAKDDARLAFNMRVVAGTALTFLYIYLITIVGYFYVTPVFAVCLLLLLGYRKPLQILMVSVGFTLMAYVVFYRLLAVRFPV